MATDYAKGAWVDAPDGTRTWDDRALPPPSEVKPRKPRKPRVRALNAGGVDRWAKGTWKWSAPDPATGLRTRIPLTAEEREAKAKAAEESAQRRAVLDAILSEMAAPLLTRPGDVPVRKEHVLLRERPEEARILLDGAERENGMRLRIYAREWTTRDGEVIPYCNIHVHRARGEKSVRTFGVAVRASELRAVIDALSGELSRIEAEAEATAEPAP